MAQQITVLLTCVAGPLVPRAIEILRQATDIDYRIVGIDAQTDAVGAKFCDVFVQAPMGDAPAYPQFVLELCEKEGVQVIVPWSDEEALAVALHRGEFERRGIAVAAPPVEIAQVTRNKADVLDLLRDRNVPVPAYRRAKTVDEIIAAAKEMGYPEKTLTIKPCVARGGRGVWALRASGASLDELLQGIALDVITLETFVDAARRGEMPEVILMPFFPGIVYDVDILQDGNICHYMVPRRRFHVRTNPFRGCVIHDNPAVMELAKRVRDAIDMHCLYDIDVILDEQNKPWILEINPRLSASVVATMEAGLPLIDYLIRMVLGLDIPERPVPYNRRVRPFTALSSDEFVHQD
jgi:carbamoyl-phosphate synthase large subunit